MKINKSIPTFLLSFFIVLPTINAQVVTFQPSFATQNDPLVIVFDATQGDGGLENFTGDVYLHTGLITSKSATPSDWQYVPNGWDEYPAKVKATPLGNNKWEFKYLPSIREFFGVTDETENVLEVAMLFRGTNTGTGNPVAVGRGNGGEDIFVELSSGDISVRWDTPITDASAIAPNETIDFLGLGNADTGTLNLTVFVDGSEVASAQNNSISYSFSSSTVGNFAVKLVADNGLGLEDSTIHKVVVFKSILEPRPNGLIDGITYSDTNPSTVMLSLFAPRKSNVFVIGDFNDWKVDFDFVMKKDSVNRDEIWFWAEINDLAPGREYGFQYLVDGSINIPDPYSELVLSENDQHIPESVFPNLKEYPSDKTSHYVTVLSPGKTEFVWEAPDFERPDNDELMIYELLLRDFIEDHSFQTLLDTLDYLDNLGVNAIELMPINEFDGNESWGYNPSLHYAIDKYYGTPEAFKRFVDECHKREIIIILDVVLNHASGQNPLVRLYNSGGTSGPTADNPYFFTVGQHPANVFNDMNHYYLGTEYYSKRVMEHWLTEYKVDGFRFDLSKGFIGTNTNWDAYNPARIALWKRYADHIWSVDAGAYVILEHFGTDREEDELSEYGKGMMFWGGANINERYNEATMGYHANGISNLNVVIPEFNGFTRNHMIGYFESHDEQWLMFKNISFGACSNFPLGGNNCETAPGNYSIRDLGTALDRMELAGAFFFTLPGPKMIWQFAELGYGYGDDGEECLKPGDGSDGDCLSSAPGRTDNKPIRWDYYEDTDRRDVYDTFSNLINLRYSSPVFTRPEGSFYALSGDIKYTRLLHTDSDVVIIGNFGVSAKTENVDFTRDGVWYDHFGESTINVTGGVQSIELAPGAFKLFTTKNFGTVVSSEEEAGKDKPAGFALYPNYPNPFNPSTNITFDVPKTGLITLEVYDSLGRKVSQLVNEVKSVGTYTATFNASSLSSGLYFVRLQADGFIQTQKMTLLK